MISFTSEELRKSVKDDEFVVRGNVAFFVIEDPELGKRLIVANVYGGNVDWTTLIDAYDVEDWTGTMWEDRDPGRVLIDQFRGVVESVFAF